MCSGTTFPLGQHIATVVLLVAFFVPTVLDMYLHMVHNHREKEDGYTKLLPLDIIKKRLSNLKFALLRCNSIIN